MSGTPERTAAERSEALRIVKRAMELTEANEPLSTQSIRRLIEALKVLAPVLEAGERALALEPRESRSDNGWYVPLSDRDRGFNEALSILRGGSDVQHQVGAQ